MLKYLRLLVFFVGVNCASAQIFIEDFDGSNTTATTSTSGCGVGDNDDYFGITNETVINQDYTGDDGNFLGAQDTDGAGCSVSGSGSVSASIDGIDISGQTGLILCFKIAEGTASDGEEDWDGSSNVTISVQIDGGTSQELFVVEAVGGGNTQPGVDCDGDGSGSDGPAITSSFTEYCVEISGTGSLLDIDIDISGLDAGDEDIALDDFTVHSNEDAGTPSGVNPCVTCDVSWGLATYTCSSFTVGDNNDMVVVSIPYLGNHDVITSVTTTTSATVGGDDPANVNNGTVTLTGLMEGDSWDITLNGGVCDNVSISGSIPSDLCSCMDPVASGTCSIDMQMDMTTTTEATDAPNTFHNSIMDCATNFMYVPVYGELADDGDGNNSTGVITGLVNEDGVALTASYEVGHVDLSCTGSGITSNLTGGTISTGGSLQAGSPKPTSLFSTHYTENTGSGGLNAVKITLNTGVENFGIFLGDWESSSHGTLGEVWAFDSSGDLICTEDMNPVLYGPITDESGCGANQGDDNCGNETTTWVEITSPSNPITCVLLVLGDDDSCVHTSECEGISEHLSFGGITTGGICSPILPIELLNFNAVSKNRMVDLQWVTVSERNNEYFDIQWSTDKRSFQSIGKIDGQGDSNLRSTYNFKHTYPDQGHNYYRLKQVDLNGSFSYSKVISEKIDFLDEVTIYPSVVTENVNIELTTGISKIYIYNINGTIVKSISLDNESTCELNLENLLAGSYVVTVISEENTTSRRIIKL